MSAGPRRVLVTGASGFVGRHLVGKLAAWLGPQAEILAVGGPSAESGAWAAHPQVRFTAVDLSAAPLDDLIAGFAPDVSVHLAAQSSNQQAFASAHDTFANNLTSTLRLIEALRRRAPGSRLVFASTGEVYGAAFNTWNAPDEDAPIRPMGAYARSKAACEFAVQDVLSDVCDCVVLRLFNHFGPGQDERFVLGSFAAQLRRIAAGEAPPVMRVGNLDAERDFLDVEDVLDAYRAAIELPSSGPSCRIFNIGSGRARSIRSALDDLVRLSGVSVSVERDPARLRPSEVPISIGKADRFRAASLWAPHREWEGSLRRLLAIGTGKPV